MIPHRYNWILRNTTTELKSLRFFVSWNNRKRVAVFHLGYSVEPDKFSKDTNRCRNNSFHGEQKISSYDINRRIVFFEDCADTIFSENEDISEEDFKKAFNLLIGRNTQTEDSIFKHYDQFILSMGGQHTWSLATVKKHRTIRNHLFKFNKRLAVCDITNDMMDSFLQYLIGQGFKNTYSVKLLKDFKWFVHWLRSQGIYKGNSHIEFNPKLRGTNEGVRKIIYLDWNELMAIYNLKGLRKNLSEIRDFFCFCCFTSLRYSDAANLKRKDIQDGKINVVTQKTTDSISIELNKYSKSILDKYKDVEFPGDLALPVVSNQKTNFHLKEIAKLAELDSPITMVSYNGSRRIEKTYKKWELITTHCGRRTFVVNALFLGIPSDVIIKWTGHSDYKSMKPYIAIVDKLKLKEMEKFNGQKNGKNGE